MKNNKLSDLTADELYKEKKSLTGIVLATGIVMLILSIVMLYLIITKHKFAFAGVVPICLLTLLPSLIRLNEINSEIKSRNSA